MPWWSPENHADRRPLLLKRGRLKAAIRAHFEAQGFTEVECGALVVSPGNETHLHAFETQLTGPDGESHSLYLHTSPEFAAKKLLAAGEQRIFDFARVFRNRERSRLHAPEFTMPIIRANFRPTPKRRLRAWPTVACLWSASRFCSRASMTMLRPWRI